ncbi:membrane protein [Indibacter alkaliphilus LW1]|uniref:Membrane protein n=1 Tax=Indibacter alkaliphilus (strain CCUG 57479 / KCTC 22604 / LW1) TaxID=1189612 RepID=S2DHZ6_INDAL|nr:YfcC family protein [Indibacter alkaliphilus]EOZ98632.1 membrane protein [Indibacter alkaliphilus LW1]
MRKLSFPHPMIIMLAFVMLATLLTYLIPAGQFERMFDDNTGREVVIQGSYRTIESNPVGLEKTALSIPEGIIEGVEVVVLILIIGGAFYVVEKTGAFQSGLEALIHKFSNARGFLLSMVGILFATAGTLNGLQEEIIAMVPLLLILSAKIGFSKKSIVGLCLGSALIGGAFGPTNPFSVIIAQKVAEVPVFSGGIYRMVFFIISLAFWIFYMIRHGKAKEETSGLEVKESIPQKISKPHVVILWLVAITFGIMIYGLSNWNWDYNEMSAIFFVMGLAAGIIGSLGINGTAKAYSEGFAELVFAGIIVGLARSIYLVLEEGQIIDTIIYGLFTPLEDLPLALSALGMMLSQALLHIPVPSTSGQAVLTMPLLTPIADLIGMSRQVVVLAYQYGAGIMDMVTPSNGGLMAILAAAGVSYKEWIAFAWRPILVVFGIAGLSVVAGIFIL